MTRITRTLMVFLFPLAFVLDVTAEVFEHPGGLHSRNQLELVRRKIDASAEPWATACKALLGQAREGLKHAPKAVANFNVPGYYVDPEGHSKAKSELSADAWTAYSCAIAYQLMRNEERTTFADKAIQILTAWSTTNTKVSNHDGDLSMAYVGVGLVFAAELITDYTGWNTEQRTLFSKWLTTVYLKSCTNIAPRANNWGDWGILGCCASHYFLNDAKGLDDDIVEIRTKIDNEIEADGHMPKETGRGKNGIWYTYFALAPLTAACQISENARSVDLFHYKGRDGAGIEQALDYLFRYCQEPRKWPHYTEKDLSLPKPGQWPGNLYEVMSGIYGNTKYESWVKEARPIMVYGHHFAWTVPTLLSTAPSQKETLK